jgi:hypothetical protein
MNADGSDQRQILADVTERLKIIYRGVNERVISWAPPLVILSAHR